MADIRDDALEWQVGVWDSISDIYAREVDRRFAPVVDALLAKSKLVEGERALDLGTGTGSVAFAAAKSARSVTGVDLSPEMVAIAEQRAISLGLDNVEFRLGRGEEIPVDDGSIEVVLSSLCLMYVLDRNRAAGEIARVLAPGGRLSAAVWGPPGRCDIVRFQATAGKFAPPPPAEGVGPGALADPSEFLDQLSRAGIHCELETEVTEFEFPNFDLAWDVLAGVTTAQLDPQILEDAKDAVRVDMWPEPEEPRTFSNLTHFIVGKAQ